MGGPEGIKALTTGSMDALFYYTIRSGQQIILIVADRSSGVRQARRFGGTPDVACNTR